MLAIRLIIPTVVLALIAAAPAVAGRVPMPKIPAAKGAHCVRPTQWMRKNHMKLLMQLRYEAVHEGIRHKRESLPGCIACHVSRLPDGKYPSASSKEFFCNACHEYVGTRIDCFSCHSSRPDAAYEMADGLRHPVARAHQAGRGSAAGWAGAMALVAGRAASSSSRGAGRRRAKPNQGAAATRRERLRGRF